MFLTADEKTQLRDRIQVAESNTSGEIVTVIAQRSDDYLYIPLLWATLCSLAVPGLTLLINNYTWQASDSFSTRIDNVYILQVAVFFLLALIFQWQPVKHRLVPRSVQQDRAAKAARAQFLEQKVHTTEHRAGILIYVSLSERYVEILTDSAVAAQVPDEQWQATVDRFVSRIRSAQTFEGFCETIDDCQQILCSLFPHAKAADQILPDHLIEIG